MSSELTIHIINTVSTRTLRRQPHKAGIYRRAAIPKPLITKSNTELRKKCDDHKNWTSRNGKTLLVLMSLLSRDFLQTGVFMYGEHRVKPIIPAVKYGGGPAMIWAEISWYSSDPIITLNGRSTVGKYLDIPNDNVLTMATVLLPESVIFQHVNAPIQTAKKVKPWFDKHYNVIKHLPWPAKSPDLSKIERLWGVLE